MSVFQLISLLFCFRYSGHNSVLYIESCLEYLKHASFYSYHVGVRGEIVSYFSILQYTMLGMGGGGVSLLSFHSAYQCCMPPMADQLSSCCTVIDI